MLVTHDVDAVFGAYSQLQDQASLPEVVIMPHEGKTRLFRLGHESVVLGEEKDFDSIWIKLLLGR